MGTLKIYTIAVLTGIFTMTAQAAPITSFNYSTAGGQSGPAVNYLDLEMSITDINSSNPYALDYTVFDDLVFNAGDLGNTFTSNASTDSGFVNFSNQLTNGIVNNMSVYTLFSSSSSGGGSGGGQFQTESAWLFGKSGLGDLAGYIIQSIDVTVNSIAFYQNYEYLPGRFINYWSQADFTITFNGYQASVPEPTSFSLLLISLFGFLYFKRKKLK